MWTPGNVWKSGILKTCIEYEKKRLGYLKCDEKKSEAKIKIRVSMWAPVMRRLNRRWGYNGDI